jgi:hypothetical protein
VFKRKMRREARDLGGAAQTRFFGTEWFRLGFIVARNVDDRAPEAAARLTGNQYWDHRSFAFEQRAAADWGVAPMRRGHDRRSSPLSTGARAMRGWSSCWRSR